MSLQTCHCCGWSKVTTYQGLRIHQGRMGCTPAGVRVAEPEQKNLWGHVQMDLKLDVRIAVKTESTYYNSDLSLQVCHCGWNKMTTYQGLRIHQGKMGCTPNGIRIPRTEQKYWKDYWEQEVDPRQRPPAEIAVRKPENFPAQPRVGRSINSAAAAAVKGKHKSAPVVPPHSSIQPHSGHQLEERSARPQVNGPVRGHPSAVGAKKKITKSQTLPQNINKGGTKDYQTDSCDKYSTAAGRIEKEPVSSYATPKVSRKSNSPNLSDELLDFSSSMQMKRHQGRNDQVTSSFLRRQRDGRDLTSPRVNTWIKEPPEPVFLPKEKHLEDRRVNQLVREQPSAPPVVPVKKKDSPLLTERQEGYKAQLLQEFQNCLEKRNKMRKGKLGDIKPTEPIYQNVIELQRQYLSSVKSAATMEENKSRSKTPPDSLKEPTNTNPAAAEQMNSSVRKHLKIPPLVLPKKNSLLSTRKQENSEGSSATATQEKEKLKQKVVLSRSIDSPKAAAFMKENQSPVKTPKESLKNSTNTKAAAAGQVNRKPLVPPKKKNPPLSPTEPKKSESATETENLKHLQGQNKKREEEIHDVKPVERNCENVADVTSANNKPEAAETPSDDPTAVSTEQPDITTGRTVKNLAKMFSVITNEEKAARPTEELRHSQVKRVARWLSAVRPEKEKPKLMQSATDTPKPQKASAAAEVQQREAPASVFEAAESEFSTGMKVRELARRFSLQETAAPLKERNHVEEQKPSQKSSDSTGAATKSDPAAHEASQMSGFSSGLKSATDTPKPQKASAAAEVQQREAPASVFEAAESEFSTGMKVRELARRFSLQETAAPLKERNHVEEQKPSQVKFQAQRIYRPQLRKQVSNQKRGTWEELKLTQKSSDSTGAATKSDPAAHEASQMSGFSSGLKVKDLVRRFSAG